MDEAALNALREKFRKALDNDLNTSLAVTALYDALKAQTNGATKLAALADFDTVLGLDLIQKAEAVRKAAPVAAAGGFMIQGEGDPEIDALVRQRAEAKKAKDFATADRIRDELKAKGIEITDTKDGAVWKRV